MARSRSRSPARERKRDRSRSRSRERARDDRDTKRRRDERDERPGDYRAERVERDRCGLGLSQHRHGACMWAVCAQCLSRWRGSEGASAANPRTAAQSLRLWPPRPGHRSLQARRRPGP